MGRFSIRQGDWKLLLSPGSGGVSPLMDYDATQQGLSEMQLYNLKDDIEEQHNLVDQYPEKVVTLLKLLESTVSNGRSTPGSIKSNDVSVDIWKKNLNNEPIKRIKK